MSATASKERLMSHYKAAVGAHQAQELDVALEEYRAVLAIQPIAQVHNNMGARRALCFAHRTRTRTLYDVFESISRAHTRSAAILLQKGRKAEAEESWRSAVELNPAYAEAHYNLAVLLSEAGDAAKLREAEKYCESALAHREGYVQAHHLMGNIRMSLGAPDEAASWYAKAEALAAAADGGGSSGGASGAAGASASASSAAATSYRWDGVEVGHTRTLRLPSGAAWEMETLSLRPLAFLVRGFLSADECEQLVALAQPKMRGSLMMGNASGSERTSTSVFLPASEDALLGELQRRLAALTQLPPRQVAASEDLQVVHYEPGQSFGMHHDSSRFLPRALVSFAKDRTPLARTRVCTRAHSGSCTKLLHRACACRRCVAHP